MKKLHLWLRGHNNPLSVWLKYRKFFDGCWEKKCCDKKCKGHAWVAQPYWYLPNPDRKWWQFWKPRFIKTEIK